MTSLTNEALRLPPEERLRLIEDVWESFVSDPASLPVSAQQMEELDRRKKHYSANPDSLIDWEEMKSRLRKRGEVES